MRGVRTGFLLAAVTCLMGTSTAAWACDVFGSIVCRTDPKAGVSGVEVILTSVPDGIVKSTASLADGSFYMHVDYANMEYDVNLLAENVFCNANGDPIYIDPILVDDSVQCAGTPPPPPPPPACTISMPAGVTFPYCPARPIGNPKSECGLFDLAVLDKNDSINASSITASQTAALALVKAGGCYDVFLNVTEDVTVLTAPYSQSISHITYCICRTP